MYSSIREPGDPIRVSAIRMGAGPANARSASRPASEPASPAGKPPGADHGDAGPDGAAGQTDIGEELVRHIQGLRRYARALVGQPADADDLVQETLKRALLYNVGRRRIDNLRAYLMRILHNVRRDDLIRRARAGATVDVDDVELVSDDASPGERMACKEAIEAMRLLPEKQRQVLVMVAIEGISYREAAEILELPIGTIMSRLNRARAALRQMLDGDEAPAIAGE